VNMPEERIAAIRAAIEKAAAETSGGTA